MSSIPKALSTTTGLEAPADARHGSASFLERVGKQLLDVDHVRIIHDVVLAQASLEPAA